MGKHRKKGVDHGQSAVSGLSDLTPHDTSGRPGGDFSEPEAGKVLAKSRSHHKHGKIHASGNTNADRKKRDKHGDKDMDNMGRAVTMPSPTDDPAACENVPHGKSVSKKKRDKRDECL